MEVTDLAERYSRDEARAYCSELEQKTKVRKGDSREAPARGRGSRERLEGEARGRGSRERLNLEGGSRDARGKLERGSREAKRLTKF
jgi:hypothetical protein